LIYATAQNQACTLDRKRTWWRQCVGYGPDSLWRMHYDPGRDDSTSQAPFLRGPDELPSPSHRFIWVDPVKQGILVALIGLLKYVRMGKRIDNLDDATRRIACTNFFKFSLTKGTADFNPLKLADETKLRIYIDQTIESFVQTELAALKPGAVLTFEKRIADSIRPLLPENRVVIPINDPAWIKRGMGGCASENGNWRRRVESTTIPSEVASLVSGYLDQCVDIYRGELTPDDRSAGRKRESARIFLLYYFIELRDSLRTG
jgi:hypothetical protein